MLLQRLVELCPEELLYCDRLASLLERLGQTGRALACYRDLLRRQPAQAAGRFNYARLLKRCGQLEAALEQYQETLRRGISQAEEVYSNISGVLTELHRDAEAEAALRSALELQPDYVPALYNLALLQEERGEWSRACALLQRILELQPGHCDALVRLANGESHTDPGHPLILQLQQTLAMARIAPLERENLNFALGKVFDDCGDYSSAFEHYRLGNRESRERVGPYARDAQEKLVDALRGNGLAGVGPVSDEPLIFICGMFRSGSTLLEQALAAHPELIAGGEINFFNLQAPLPAALSLGAEQLQALATDYLGHLRGNFPGRQRVTNKRPDNFFYLGLLHTLFPNARFIHSRRQPLDTCLSIYFQQFEAPLTWHAALLDIGHFYVQYDRMMKYWQAQFGASIAALDYEQLVDSPRSALEPVLTFLGLDWDEACLDFHKLDNRVRTASVTQVRQALYQSSVGRWGNYAEYLEPLRDYLRSAGIET